MGEVGNNWRKGVLGVTAPKKEHSFLYRGKIGYAEKNTAALFQKRHDCADCELRGDIEMLEHFTKQDTIEALFLKGRRSAADIADVQGDTERVGKIAVELVDTQRFDLSARQFLDNR